MNQETSYHDKTAVQATAPPSDGWAEDLARRYFPFPTMNAQQYEAWRYMVNSAAHSPALMFELPTGVGKSGLAVGAARAWREIVPESLYGEAPGAYTLTTQRILQKQYARDFDNSECGLKTVWSKQAYDCLGYSGTSCAGGMLMKKRFPGTPAADKCQARCPYIRDLRAFLNSSVSVTNTAWFLNQAAYTDALKERDLLVIDECHNLEDALVSFVGIDVTREFCYDELNIDWPGTDRSRVWTPADIARWIRQEYQPKFTRAVQALEAATSSEKSGKHDFKLLNKYVRMDNELCAVNRFLNDFDPQNWVVNVGQDRWELRPIEVHAWGEEFLFSYAKRVVLMSATIMDPEVYTRSIGIDFSKTGFMRADSPFPDANRPVLFAPVGSMSKTQIDRTLPNIVRAVQRIVDRYPDQKGIIHCHTYKIAEAIKNGVRAPTRTGGSRLLSHGSHDRDRVYERHLRSKEPTVLISPSMAEGVDLKGDLSRFQIVCKVPYANLGDERIRTKCKRDQDWYNCLTARTIVQMTGRSVRSVDDWAHTYILDSDFGRFIEANARMIPNWWLRTLGTAQVL